MNRSLTRVQIAPRAVFESACSEIGDVPAALALVAARRAHAFEVAALARDLAPLAGVCPEQAHAAGLLHDIGELLLLQRDPAGYAALLSAGLDHHDRLRAEKDEYGTDHPLLAAEHLLDLRVPDVIADAVADHHDPIAGSADTTMVVATADELLTRSPGERKLVEVLRVDDAVVPGHVGALPEPPSSSTA